MNWEIIKSPSHPIFENDQWEVYTGRIDIFEETIEIIFIEKS